MKTGRHRHSSQQNFATAGPPGARPSPASRTPPTPSRPTGPGRWAHGGHRRHRHPGLLDHRRLRGPARPRRLPLHRRRRWATPAEAAWATAASTAASWRRPTPCSARPSASTTSTTCPARWCSPTPPTGAPNPRTPTGRRRFGFGSWAWEGYLLGAPRQRPRAYHDRRHLRLRVRAAARHAPARDGRRVPRRLLLERLQRRRSAPPAWRAAPTATRGSSSYEFMIANSQSGPYSWWESSSAPTRARPGSGGTRRPGRDRRPTPGAWPAPTRSCSTRWWRNGPTARSSWAAASRLRGCDRGAPITVTNFPTSAGGRAGITITSQRHDGLPDPARRGATGAGPVPAPLVRPRHAGNVRRHGRRGVGHGHRGAPHAARHGHPAQGALGGLSTP